MEKYLQFVDAVVALLVAFGWTKEKAVDLTPNLLTTWSGLAILTNMANFMAKEVPAYKKTGYALKQDIMRAVLDDKPAGLGKDDEENALRWKLVDLEGAPQVSVHAVHMSGSEDLPKVKWEGTRWQNRVGLEDLLARWEKAHKKAA